MKKACLCSPGCAIPYGTCHCGCGKATSIAPQTSVARHMVKGEPLRYARGHARGERRDLHILTDLDERDRSATCSRCGPVTIVKDSERQRWKCYGAVTIQHAIVDANPETKTGYCRGCKTIVPLYSYKRGWACKPTRDAANTKWRNDNREHVRDTHRAWRDDNREHLRAYSRLKNYGLTVDEYEALLEKQGGVCAICLKAPSGQRQHAVLHVDHDHENGSVRGLLCSPCNVAIGSFADDPETLQRAIAYLMRAA